MPYAKRRGKRGGNKVVRGLRKRARIYGGAAYQLYKDVSWLKSVINVEKKYLDYTVTAQNVTSTGSIPLINGMQTGDTASTRDGQSVKFYSMTMQGNIAMSNSAETSQVRIAIVLDRQANAVSPTITNIWTAATPTALRVIGTGARFRILRDMRFALSNGGKECVSFNRTMKLRFHTKFNTSNVGDISDITTNALYLVYLSDQATNYPVLNLNIRLRFIDN